MGQVIRRILLTSRSFYQHVFRRMTAKDKGVQIFITGGSYIYPQVTFDATELTEEKDSPGIRRAEI